MFHTSKSEGRKASWGRGHRNRVFLKYVILQQWSALAQILGGKYAHYKFWILTFLSNDSPKLDIIYPGQQFIAVTISYPVETAASRHRGGPTLSLPSRPLQVLRQEDPPGQHVQAAELWLRGGGGEEELQRWRRLQYGSALIHTKKKHDYLLGTKAPPLFIKFFILFEHSYVYVLAFC